MVSGRKRGRRVRKEEKGERICMVRPEEVNGWL